MIHNILLDQLFQHLAVAMVVALLMAQQGNGLGLGPPGQLLHLLDLMLHLFQVSLSELGERDLPFVPLLQEFAAGPQVLAPLVYRDRQMCSA